MRTGDGARGQFRPALVFALILVVILTLSPETTQAETTIVSRDSAGEQMDGEPYSPVISGNGRIVAFTTLASNLVSGDTNEAADVFVHDRQSGQTTRVSVDSSGAEANGGSYEPRLSGDGRYVVFISGATNLVADDTNEEPDVFVHDRQTGATTRVNVSSSGDESNEMSDKASISDDGTLVAFVSLASNLVANDNNSYWDVFVHDRQTGATSRVSVDSSGAEADGTSRAPRISGDGRYVVFESSATNLVADDANSFKDIFVHDRQTGATTLVSVDSSGAQTNGESWTSSISSDGRYVAFLSMATLLVSGDDNWEDDVFLHDRQTSQTIRVSVDSAGAQADDRSTYPNISGDGRHVSFISDATNLVAGDTNNWPDVFVHHLDGGETVRVNVADDGTQANGYTIWSSISNSGACVTFVSGATNLAIGDDNNERDVFVNGPRLGSQPPLLLLQD
jgi:hypothetical protein